MCRRGDSSWTVCFFYPQRTWLSAQQTAEAFRGLRPLAASHNTLVPGLASGCSVACWDISSVNAEYPSFDLVSSVLEDAPDSDTSAELSSDSAYSALASKSLWMRAADFHNQYFKVVAENMFSVQQLDGCATCCMHALSVTTQSITVELQHSQCVALGRNGCGATLSIATFKVTFYLASDHSRCDDNLLCMLLVDARLTAPTHFTQGSVQRCSLYRWIGCLCGSCTFNSVSFKHCSLLVLSGVQAVLQDPVFKLMARASACSCMELAQMLRRMVAASTGACRG